MDLRFAVFTRIARDDVLKRLLVNYADRLDDLVVGDGTASDTCYLTLEWSADDRTTAPPEAESVTFRAHVPRHDREGASCLDVVMCRLEAALAADGADGSISILRRRSPEVVESGADTIFKTTDLRHLTGAAARSAGVPDRPRSDAVPGAPAPRATAGDRRSCSSPTNRWAAAGG